MNLLGRKSPQFRQGVVVATGVLLLGYGGAGHPGSHLTDAILLVTSSRRTGSMVIISIPRDLLVPWKSPSSDSARLVKINNVFASLASNRRWHEGLLAAEDVVEMVTGIRSAGCVALDFDGFRTLVGELGGLDIEVAQAFAGRYPAGAGWKDVGFGSGTEHMNPDRALEYARIRYVNGAEGNDFARMARQQQVFLAILRRLVADVRVVALFPRLRGHIHTHIRPTLIVGLLPRVVAGLRERPHSIMLSPRNALVELEVQEHGYVLIPRAGNWQEIHRLIAASLS